MPTLCRHVLVSGRVQGVAFRWYTVEKAGELGLAGWVKNLPDGRVETWIEGEASAIESMLARFKDSQFRFRELIIAVVTSDLFLGGPS